MKNSLTVGLLSTVAILLATADAQAFGRRKKKNNDCCPAPVVTAACGGCGTVGYATVGGTNTYTSAMPGMAMSATPMPGTTMPMNTTGVAPTTTTAMAGKPGTIMIMVPNADTQVFFEDTALPQTGKERTFKTPALTEGKTYNYTVKAKWKGEDGKAMEKSMPVSLKAGQTANVDFTK